MNYNTMDIVNDILNKWYPDYNNHVLPPDILKMILSYLAEVKHIYYNNGVLRCSQNIFNDRICDGYLKIWRDNKHILEIAMYKNGVRNGMTKIFKIFCNKHIASAIERYVDGSLHGTSVVYDLQGRVKDLTPYKNGLIHGNMVSYNPTGTLFCVCQFENGKINGEYIAWYPSGQKNTHYHYRHDRLNGMAKTWDHEGNLTSSQLYVNGYIYNESLCESLTSP